MHPATHILQEELLWLQRLVQYRAAAKSTDLRTVPQLAPPSISPNSDCYYAKVVNEYQLNFEERALLILALAPTIAPQFLDKEIAYWAKPLGVNATPELMPMWGVVYGNMYRGILPTATMFVYLVVGDVFDVRMELVRKIASVSYKPLATTLVCISDVPVAEPKLNGILSIHENFLLDFLF